MTNQSHVKFLEHPLRQPWGQTHDTFLQVADRFSTIDGKTVRNGRYKLIRFACATKRHSGEIASGMKDGMMKTMAVIQSLQWRLLCFIVCLVPTCVAQVPEEKRELSSSSRHEISVEANNGRIAWADVADQIAQRIRLDASSLRQVFPAGDLDLNSPATAFALIGIDLALGDAVSLHLQPKGGGKSQLRVVFDERAFAWLQPKRNTVAATIDWDSSWAESGERAIAAADFVQPKVIFVHGLKSSPKRFDEIRRYLRSKGFATAAAGYDDQQSVRESAKQLSALLQSKLKTISIGNEGPLHDVVLVGHSMGGLVAREWIENKELYHPSLKRLITVGTPHKGSSWASMPPLLDLFDDGNLDVSGVMDVLLHKNSAAGMNDLMPGSSFLESLNARPRRPGVQYTSIVGTGSPVTEAEVLQARETLRRLSTEDGFLKAIQPRIRPLLGSFDEVIQGQGDGVVAVSSATIPGVDDTVIVPLAHIDFFRSSAGESVPDVWREIEKRLK